MFLSNQRSRWDPPYTHAHAHFLPKPPSSFLSSVTPQIPMFFKRYFLTYLQISSSPPQMIPLTQAAILKHSHQTISLRLHPVRTSWPLPIIILPPGAVLTCPPNPPHKWGGVVLRQKLLFPYNPFINPPAKWSAQLPLSLAWMAALANG